MPLEFLSFRALPVTLDEGSKDGPLVERLGDSVVLYEGRKWLLFRREQRPLKLF